MNHSLAMKVRTRQIRVKRTTVVKICRLWRTSWHGLLAP